MLFPLSLSWEINLALGLGSLPADSDLVFKKKKKNKTSAWCRGTCLLKTSLKALSAPFLSSSRQSGCSVNFATVTLISCGGAVQMDLIALPCLSSGGVG